ncbi:hypothetical protein [Streptomyces sp. NBC_01190]|uniref:hypothetical protein n=1 Tax=Streptomyces sp. NBC_01190 TaxID=2903767 RepID=UPI00386EEA6D|nr:hypothetical protein OG519_05990 [Streptomyces sp. NBC_01190]
MSERNTVLRSVHDLGLAAWFGGALMGAVGVNGAARQMGSTDRDTARIASTGWGKWAPLGAAAVGAHLVGGAGLLNANKDRVRNQAAVTASTAAKTLLTGAALAATAYTRVLGKKVDLASSDDPEKREMSAKAPGDPDQAKRQLSVMQWVVPALTAGLVILNALHGEQQRPFSRGTAMMRRMSGIMGR